MSRTAVGICQIARLLRKSGCLRTVRHLAGRSVESYEFQDIRARVGMLELDIAKIGHSSIARHFDRLESKIDKLYDFVLERLTKLPL